MSTASPSPSQRLTDISDATHVKPSRSQTSLDDVPNARSSDVELPPEIWLRIFDFLVYIPGILDISNVRAIEAYAEDNEGIILHGLYNEAMSMKLAISLVSRSWRRLILPFLFEYVIIRSARQARVVADVLSRFHQAQGEEKYYGRWTKRVEVIIQDDHWEQDSIDALVTILRLAPNILVFSDFFSTGRLPNHATRNVVNVLHSLSEKGRLRRIECSGVLGVFRLYTLLCGTPSLQVLITRQLLRYPITLPNLRILVVRKSDLILPYKLSILNAPSLHGLVLHGNALNPLTGCPPTCTIIPYPNLKHLRCLYLDDKLLPLSLFRIAETPEITSLTLDFGQRPLVKDLERIRIKHQTLERINLVRFPTFSYRLDPSCEMEGQQYVSGFLEALLKRDDIPSLRTIGFHRPRSHFDTGDFTKYVPTRTQVSTAEFWENFIALCKSRGVNVETSVGASNQFWGIWEPFHVGLLPHQFAGPAATYHDSDLDEHLFG
ncbi:uncharacterized protein FOMMEDRAFT_153212 [Fomitiporia mediterranea MF3/22]|uniref:uncharacterized protein n=1 Tax=Fomitiporia mediterranea (strain MF3/22) TaxID=694068 RepID=UPI000440742D|nr:uncharacterized protein FOMMEDRAFT_153212 [Fomitiporia mediterranea MF3/22]EJD05868.1 hypothetical protein FOMMEDRAFT_153212 [Fomitiporia mediterranea MF3/22]